VYRYDSPTSTGFAYAGKQDDAPDLKNTFRLVYGFDLSSIPRHSEIVSVNVYVTCTFTSNMTTPSYKYEIYNYTGAYPLTSNAEDMWQAAANGTRLVDIDAGNPVTSWREVLQGSYNLNP
jgi:hypothetical protein